MAQHGRCKPRLVCESRRVSPCDRGTPIEKLLRSLQLHETKRGCDVGEIVFEARSDDLVVPGWRRGGIAARGITADSVQPHQPNPSCDLLVVRRDHAAFAGGDRLRRVEAEGRCMADRADGALPALRVSHGTALRRRWKCMCRIFDDLEIMMARQ